MNVMPGLCIQKTGEIYAKQRILSKIRNNELVSLLSRTNETCFSVHNILCPLTSRDGSLMAAFAASLVPHTTPSHVSRLPSLELPASSLAPCTLAGAWGTAGHSRGHPAALPWDKN